MKKVNADELRLIHSALTHFAGCMINAVDDNLGFETTDGAIGEIVKTKKGDYSMYIDDELVYTIEGVFLDIINYDETQVELIELYERMQMIEPSSLKYMTRTFYYRVKCSMEGIILNMNLPLEGTTQIGNYQVFYSHDHKFKLNLN